MSRVRYSPVHDLESQLAGIKGERDQMRKDLARATAQGADLLAALETIRHELDMLQIDGIKLSIDTAAAAIARAKEE